MTTSPFDPRGYVVGEAIAVRLAFNETVDVSGAPRLALEVGDDTRYAAWNEEASAGALLAFRYDVTREDRDEDGVSIGADALEVGDGSIRSAAGVAADLNLADVAIADDGDHLVLGAPPQQACTNERSLARRHTRVVVREWDGTPFRVDIVRNFPDFVTDADLWDLLEPVGRLADQIEAQLGYRILEVGGPIEVPEGAPVGWDQDFDRYWREDRLPRERGQLIAFYLNDNNDHWGGTGSPMNAHICCGTTSYNKRALGPMWTGDDPCCQGDANQYPKEGAAIVHEVFHLLGFKHSFDQFDLIGVEMSRGGLDRPWTSGSLSYHATWTDIEALRCIFPEGG